MFGFFSSKIGLLYLKYDNIKNIVIKNSIFIDDSYFPNRFFLFLSLNSNNYDLRDLFLQNSDDFFFNYYTHCLDFSNIEMIFSYEECEEKIKNDELSKIILNEEVIFDINIWSEYLKEYGIINCTFLNLTTNFFLLDKNGEILIKNSKILQLTTYDDIGLFKINSFTSLFLYNVSFIYCKVPKNSAIIRGEKNTEIFARLTNILDISSSTGVFNVFFGNIYLIDLKIRNIISEQGAIIYAKNSYIMIINVEINSSFSKTNGGAIHAINSILLINNSLFIKCYSNYGGVFYLLNIQSLQIFNVSFYNCISESNGNLYIEGLKGIILNIQKFICFNNFAIDNACIFLKEGIINLLNSKFISNIALKKINSFLSSFIIVQINIFDSIYYNNTAFVSIIYFNKVDSNISFMNIAFSKINLMKNIIYLSNSKIYLFNSSFINLIINATNSYNIYYILGEDAILNLNLVVLNGRNYFAGINLKYGNISINNSLFYHCFSLKGAALKIADDSILYIMNTIFIKNFAKFGGAIYFSECLLSLKHSYFLKNFGYSQSGSDIFGKNIFIQNKKEIIFFNLLIENPFFISFYIKDFSSIYFNNCSFSNLDNVSSQALYLINNNEIVIEQVKLFNLKYMSGISIFSNSKLNLKISIIQSLFVKCSSLTSGGALFIEGIFELKIINTTFYENQARISGGALFYNNLKKNDMFKIIIYNNVFYYNSAKFYGGALKLDVYYLDLYNEIIMNKNIFLLNEAINGKLISNYIYKLFLTQEFQFLSDNKINLNFKNLVTVIDLQSGKPAKLYVYILDQYSNFLILENNGNMIVKLKENNRFNGIDLFGNSVNLENGLGKFENFIIMGTPGFKFECEIIFKNEEINLSINFTINIKKCNRGEIYFNSKCIECAEGFYSLENDSFLMKKKTCDICPINAICPGKDIILPKIDYWIKDNNSITIVKCLNDGCPNQYDFYKFSIQNNIKFKFYCNYGYYGNLCRKCDLNFSEENNNCIKCSDNIIYYIKFFIFFVSSIVFLLFQYRVSLNFKMQDSLKRTCIKILINHNYYLTFITNMNVEWSNKIKSFSIFCDRYISAVPKEILNINCFIQNKVSNQNILYYKISFLSIYPFFIFIILFSLQLINYLVKTKIKIINIITNRNHIGIILSLSFTIIIYNFYSRLIIGTFQMIKCIKLDDSERIFLELDPDIECWNSNEHKYLLYYYFIPNLIIWYLGWPLLLLFVLKLKIFNAKSGLSKQFFGSQISISVHNPKNQKIDKRNIKSNQILLTEKQKDSIFQENKIYKFLTIDYKSKFYFWEIFFYFTNFMIALLNVIAYKLSPLVQSTIFIAIFVIILFINEINKPFRYNIFNNLASFSYLSTIITISMIITAIDSNRMFLYLNIHFIILIFVNGIFYFSWILIFIRVIFMKNKVKSKIKNKIGDIIKVGPFKKIKKFIS